MKILDKLKAGQLEASIAMTNCRKVAQNASVNYVDQLAAMIFYRSLKTSFSTIAFEKLLNASRVINEYTQTFEELNELKLDISLQDFKGEI